MRGPMPAVIRPAQAADVPALSELAKRTWAASFGWSIDAEQAHAELEKNRSEAYFLEALGVNTLLVAECGGDLAGYIQFGAVDIPEVGDPRAAEIHRVYVDAPYQRRGIGRRLIAAALDHPATTAADRVYIQVWEENPVAIGVYEGFGFRKAGRTRFTLGESEAVEDLVMVLERPASG
jgi:diamine N-acetyltransferase